MEKRNLGVNEFLDACGKAGLTVLPISNFLSGPGASGNARFVVDEQAVDNDDRQSAHPAEREPPNVNTCRPTSEQTVAKNPISELHEYCQGVRQSLVQPEFYFAPHNNVYFECTVSIDGHTESAVAKTKKEAKTLAAKALVEKLKNGTASSAGEDIEQANKENEPIVPPNREQSNPLSSKVADTRNYVSLLYEFCAKRGKPPPADAVYEEKANLFHCTVKADFCFGTGAATRKKDAKNLASKDLLQKLEASQRKGPI